MNKFIYIALASLLLLSCHEKRERHDQGHTNACWIYAMCACIEHEAANRGDDVHLSRQWLEAKELEEQTVTMYLLRKQSSSPMGGGREGASLRNVGPEVLYLINHYGLIPDQNEKSRMDNSNVLERKLSLLANQATSMAELQQGMKDFLPKFSLAYDTTFYYYSMKYKPWQFAESIMYYQNWQFYAPSPYHPHGEKFALEVPDNRRYHEYVNLSMQELLPMVIRSLRHGHYVYWELGRKLPPYGGGSGRGRGRGERLVTSNHAMAIIGIAKNGNLICLNSYGSHWGNHGLCTVTQKDFLEHTCNIGIIQ